MKKHMLRAISLFLAVLMAFAVCGCKKAADKEKTVYDPLPGEVPVDLGGYKFTVLDFNSSRWNKESSGTPHADAWLQIMDEVEYLYNCEIEATYIGPDEIFNKVQPEVMAGGKAFDLIVPTEWGFGQLLGANLMLDLNELDVNWDNEWWNQSIRETTTFNNKSFVGGGSFIFDTAQTWLVYFNRAMWDQHGFPDPYELVDSGKWTYDRFREYAMAAAHDTDGSGALDSSEDIYGIIAASSDFCDAWFQGMGGRFFRANETTGRVEVACNDDRTFDIVAKMQQLIRKDNVYASGGANEAERVQLFVSGNALFYCYMVGKDGLQDMEDDWGVLPMPKYNEEQERYLSGVDHNASVFGVTNTNDNLYEVSILLEALGRHAMILEDIYWPDYKDTYWRDPESARIVADYVVGHGRHDLALIMQRCNTAFNAARGKIFHTSFIGAADFPSYIDAAEDAIEITIQDFFEESGT